MMDFVDIYLGALPVILGLMTLIWLYSIIIRNAGIVDPFWGPGFVVAAIFYFVRSEGEESRQWIVLLLVSIWGLRLFIHLLRRNWGKEEDFRYQNFRKNYGEKRYWWVSFFQVFMLQGFLMWLISAPILGAMYAKPGQPIGLLDGIAVVLWLIGFTFETGSDLQLNRFKSNPGNKGKLLTSGFWKYTRHPNYFGDAAVWWSYGLFSIAAGSYLPVLGSLLMTFLLLKVSGVSLLEKSLNNRPGYAAYKSRTSAFIPWFKKNNDNPE